MRIALIAAMSENGVIGRENRLPWHIPEELQYFKKMTLGKPVIMGRKTFESMGSKPLPKRLNVILTHDKAFLAKDCEVVHSVEQALQLVSNHEEVMVIGGAKIYQAFLPLANRLYLSVIHQKIEGDTFFPHWDESQWIVQSQEDKKEFSTKVLDKKN